jgi:Zn-dependent protease with chaperone function
LYLDSNYHWYDWIHMFAFLDNFFFIEVVLFILIGLIYPFVWTRNKFVNAESTTWEKTSEIIEKLGTIMGKIVFILLIGFLVLQFSRMIFKW